VKDDCVYLLHIRDAVNRIFEYSKEGAEEFLRDTKTQDAVVRNREIIGEAVKHISERRGRSTPIYITASAGLMAKCSFSCAWRNASSTPCGEVLRAKIKPR
jgi:Protein of unknown function DUF86